MELWNTCSTNFDENAFIPRDIDYTKNLTIVDQLGAGLHSKVFKVINTDNEVLALSITEQYDPKLLFIPCELGKISEYTETFMNITNWVIDKNNRLLMTMPILDGTLNDLKRRPIRERELIEVFFEFFPWLRNSAKRIWILSWRYS